MQTNTKQDGARLFFVAAVWNWLATLSFGLGYRPIMSVLGMAELRYVVFFELFLALAFVYGLGYYWVSQDTTKNHAVVRMGIIGKACVFVGLVWAAIAGSIPWVIALVGVVDLFFAVLFVRFLRQS